MCMGNNRRKKWNQVPIYVRQLKERSSDWLCPAVVYKDENYGTNYEPLRCGRMHVYVDCYWSTAIVTVHGEWKNNTNEVSVY